MSWLYAISIIGFVSVVVRALVAAVQLRRARRARADVRRRLEVATA